MENEFYPGQIFTGIYPPAAAHWCNDSRKYHIEEIEPAEDGEKQYQIVENVSKPLTDEEIAEMQAQFEAQEAERKAQAMEKLELVRKLHLDDSSAVVLAASLPEWTNDTEYEVGDYVIMNGAIYKCIEAHTSTYDEDMLDNWEQVSDLTA